MKKRGLLLLVLVVLLVLAGCRKKEPEATPPVVEPTPPPPVEEIVPEETGEIGEIAVEISRGSLTTTQLTTAVKELPALLEQYLEEEGNLEIGKVKVTVGASHAATAETLAKGNIDLAFLPVEVFVLYGGETQLLCVDAYEADNGMLKPGQQALICAAPTEYGGQLAQRAGTGKPLSWMEVSHARWGIVAEDELRCDAFDLWLWDEYEGQRLEVLPDVKRYESYEDLFRGAAMEEIDALVLPDDIRADMAEQWGLAATAEDGTSTDGFGRTERIWDEVPVLDITERLCTTVAAAAQSEDFADGRLAIAVELALERMAQEHSDMMPLLGAERFVSAESEQLDPVRRLLTMETD